MALWVPLQMADRPKRWRRGLLNAALVAALLILAFLLYGLFGNLFSSPSRQEPGTQTPGAPVDIVQVEVRNASGVPGVARRATLYLRQQGFDVVEVTSSSTTSKQSTVIDRVGDAETARRVAAALGLTEGDVRLEERPDLMLDVTVELGEDHSRLKPFGKE